MAKAKKPKGVKRAFPERLEHTLNRSTPRYGHRADRRNRSRSDRERNARLDQLV